ncbi:dihydropteroate synthase, partial [bacterium]
FSDGGRLNSWPRAVSWALELVRQGADILDIGGESTRPGAKPVSVQQEIDRTARVIEALRGETDTPLSIDTHKPEVAEEALGRGAVILNDVTGFSDGRMAELAVDNAAIACVMHMKGEPQTMQVSPHYDDVRTEVRGYLHARAQSLQERGLPAQQIWLDPGIGFGKTTEHNLELIAGLDSLAALGYPVLVGASRKHFIGQISGDPVEERLAGSLAVVNEAMKLPRRIVRVHDVAQTRQFILVQQRLRIHRAARLRARSAGSA